MLRGGDYKDGAVEYRAHSQRICPAHVGTAGLMTNVSGNSFFQYAFPVG
jgi:hypothetical protein